LEINSSKALAIGLVKASINFKVVASMVGRLWMEIGLLSWRDLEAPWHPISPHFGAFCQLLCKEKFLRVKSCSPQ
jgi:hypothetical protein